MKRRQTSRHVENELKMQTTEKEYGGNATESPLVKVDAFDLLNS